MGQLDDAIREHLDLKRRRGADPAEIARAEREALGPVRREPGPDAAEVQAAPPFEDDPLESVSDAPPPGEPLSLHDDSFHAEPAFEDVAPAQGDPLGHDAYEHPRGPVLEEEPEIDWEEPAARSAETAFAAPQDPGEETVEHRIVEEPVPGSEDVLEETPDFLQDTPDHDRLWFEQKPPRDFDFDG